MNDVETYWVSDYHSGTPVDEMKPAYLECVAAEDYRELQATLARALHLLWIGMEVGLDPVEKDEATALFIKYGNGEAFTKSLHEIIGVDMASGPDKTVEVRWPEGPKPFCKCSLNGKRWLPDECPIHRLSDPSSEPR